MNISLVRIDDRLIHGQVTTAWLRQYPADVIFVIGDSVAANPFQKTVLQTTAPAGVTVEVMDTATAAAELNRRSQENRKVALILTKPGDIVYLVQHGIPIRSVNVGGMQPHSGSRQIAKSVSVDKSDEEAFRQLFEKGVELEIRMVPTDKKQDVARLLGFGRSG
jgi:mannose/fructose/sorbose-specific phosphotransferase system IIB component